MKLNWNSIAVVGAIALFGAACSDIATNPTRGPGAPSFLVGPGEGTKVDYTGQGFTNGALNNARCDNNTDDGGTGLGFPPASQGYLLWVLTANGATDASLYLPTALGGQVQMVQVGGTWKYMSPYADVGALSGVFARYTGDVRGKVQLVVSHGCRPTRAFGAWCSPGFWRNNYGDGAGVAIFGSPAPSLSSLLFSSTAATAATVFPTSGLAGTQWTTLQSMSLADVLAAPSTKPSATYNFGTGAVILTPFNAVGAYLTNQIPGFVFDPARIGQESEAPGTTCPLNAHGQPNPDFIPTAVP